MSRLPEAVKFINEYLYETGRREKLSQFPEVPSGSGLFDTVRIERRRLVRLRNDYLLLALFAAFMCKTTIDKLCPLDLMAAMGMLETEVSDGVSDE